MTRKKGQQDRTHFFSSHFYSALRKGPGKVAHWTKNKGINVFTLDKIFIPINQDFHWSLCVVVNPGRAVRRGTDESASSCIIFLDSLKAHRPGKVSSKIRGWLNTEWNRLEGLEQEPFGKDTMPIISPKSTCSLSFQRICSFGTSNLTFAQFHIRITAGTVECLSANMLMRCTIHPLPV